MADGESPERLPIGWIEKVVSKDGQEMKFYYNVITGQKISSKADVFRYVEMGSPSQGTRQQTRVHDEGNSENKQLLIAAPVVTSKSPDWLPQGWIVELNVTSAGRKYKRYIDPSTGRKFFSKPEVLKYLNPENGNSSVSLQTAKSIESDSKLHMGGMSAAATPRGRKPRSSGTSRQKKAEVLRYAAEGLPQGWIKEIKLERSGNKIRRDPYYTDPTSGYVFRSHLDALRFLETNDINVCASKVRKREELTFLSGDISFSEEKQSVDNPIEQESAHKEGHALISAQPPKTEESAPKEEIHAPNSAQPSMTEQATHKEENRAPSSTQQPKIPGSKRKRGRPLSAPPTEILLRRKSAEPFSSTKSRANKVSTSPCRSSTRVAGSKPETEADLGVMDNDVGNEKKGEENQRPQQLQRSEGSPLDPCLEFAVKTLRGDISVEGNKLAAQINSHQQQSPVKVGLPSFGDYAHRQM